MRKNTTKKIATIALAIAMLASFAACGKQNCDLCGQEAHCKKTTVWGEDVYLCPDCYDGVDTVRGWFN